MKITLHRCDELCICPVHGTQLLHHPPTGVHACQDPDCVHAHGVDWAKATADIIAEIRKARSVLRDETLASLQVLRRDPDARGFVL